MATEINEIFTFWRLRYSKETYQRDNQYLSGSVQRRLLTRSVPRLAVSVSTS